MKKIICIALIFIFTDIELIAQVENISSDSTAFGIFNENENEEFENLDQLKATMYLNECINTLTRIKNSKSKIVLEEEQYQLNNILAWEGVTDFYAVVEFRDDLQTGLNELVKNQISKERYQKAYEKKKNRAARDAFLNAISGVQINVNVFSAVSNVLLSSARAYMDYNKSKDELGDELDDELWELKQSEMDKITDLRKSAFGVLNEAFDKHQLKENMRLVEADIDKFYEILGKKDIEIKTQKLVDYKDVFQFFPPYWYERGCAYIDLYEKFKNRANLEEAWNCFDRYNDLYNKCVLYRSNYKSGIIALYELKYKENLTNQDRCDLIKIVCKNIKDDGNALLYCAIEYIETLNDVESGMDLMRKCLTDEEISAHSEMVLAATAYWDKLNNESLKNILIKAVANTNNINLESYILFMIKVQKDKKLNAFPLQRSLQKDMVLKPVECDGDDIKSVELVCLNDRFNFDNKEWTLRFEERDRIENTLKIDSTSIELLEKEKFFKSKNDLANKVYYFKDHPKHMYDIISSVKVGNLQYFYLSSDKEWKNDNVRECYISMDVEKGEEKKEWSKRESKYTEFYDKYNVKDVKFIYRLKESSWSDDLISIYKRLTSDEKNNEIKGYGFEPKYSYKLTIPHKNEDGSFNEKYKIDLYFGSDYLEGKNSIIHFIGIVSDNAYTKF